MTIATRHVLFSGYALVVGLLNLPTLRDLIVFGQEDVTASHLALIPLVSAFLIYADGHAIFASVRSDRFLGGSLVCLGLTLGLIRTTAGSGVIQGDTLTVPVAAIVVLWLGGFLLLYGKSAFRRALFPLLFLGLMIPIPQVVLDAAVSFLKSWTADAVGALISLTATPFYRDGFVFTFSNVAIEVADQCSGIRSSIGLVLTSLVAGHVLLSTGWKKAILVAAVVPVAVLKNGIRIATLCLLAVHGDPGVLRGPLHGEEGAIGGITFFLLALAMLAPLVAFLQRSEMSLPLLARPVGSSTGQASRND